MRSVFSVIKQYMRRHFLIVLVICGILSGMLFCVSLFAQAEPHRQPKPPIPWPEAKKPWPKQQDWLSGAEKRLETLNGITTTDAVNSEFKKLVEHATELIDQAKSSKDNQFQHMRRILAADAIMNAADLVMMTLKNKPNSDENDFRRADFILKGCYFRVRQANYFAGIIGDKKSDQYVKLASGLYQQGRSAYDAKEYGNARLLGEASTSVVFALECMAQAAAPSPYIYK